MMQNIMQEFMRAMKSEQIVGESSKNSGSFVNCAGNSLIIPGSFIQELQII